MAVDRWIDGLVASQAALQGQLASTVDAVKQNWAAPAMKFPVYNALHPHPHPPPAQFAVNPWYGVHAGVVPPGPPTGLPGIYGANADVSGVAARPPAAEGVPRVNINSGTAGEAEGLRKASSLGG